ncbi:helix-turn-helix domain-containing protein [Algibacillus agarilyticus]|uniref:helix-turn-helix domain-containing protein n=1 Tax=Algibacillus agarilyticus TaxID=2234133 RepID=UPI001E2A1EF3|nr:helix-turn-helix domain-containing protein [Algibacillus agarilyticus]
MLGCLNLRSGVINKNSGVNNVFDFKLFRPVGPLSAIVQGIWSAATLASQSIERSLYSDAGSGIIFNLSGQLILDNEVIPEGVIMLPVNKQVATITIPAGAKLAGIRFLPAIGYGVLGQHFDKPTWLSPKDDNLYNLYQLFHVLRSTHFDDDLIDVIHQWALKRIDFTNVIPTTLEKAFEHIDQELTLAEFKQTTELSQRQIERMFKLWLGMTPKHYQRILRIKKAICFLRLNQGANLVEVAQAFGFSDQAHMTREFRLIACITPGQIQKS